MVDDPRLTTHVGCGMEFMKNHEDEFDVIITDSSDPIGPASVLFESSYFNLLQKGRYKLLRPVRSSLMAIPHSSREKVD